MEHASHTSNPWYSQAALGRNRGQDFRAQDASHRDVSGHLQLKLATEGWQQALDQVVEVWGKTWLPWPGKPVIDGMRGEWLYG